VINNIFSDFKANFCYFFEECDEAFRNELIIQMFCRIYVPDTTVVNYGETF